uniref:MSP domain-containing protein n=1 Tax=Parascaris univalens TaxID=6257 RepID=A0A914ZIR8_PARUN
MHQLAFVYLLTPPVGLIEDENRQAVRLSASTSFADVAVAFLKPAVGTNRVCIRLSQHQILTSIHQRTFLRSHSTNHEVSTTFLL